MRDSDDSSVGTALRPSRTIQRNKMATTRVLSVLWRWRLTPATAPVDALAVIRLAGRRSDTNHNRCSITIFSLFPLVFFVRSSPFLPFWIFEYTSQSLIACRLPFGRRHSANAPQPPPPRSAHRSETIVYDVCRRRLCPYAHPLTELLE